ncbi:4-coumarate--CoA ligase-like 7 [Staphylotrichum tortipilum]|uniref:4-coumarate--CoA ligase-like 7 n=1 Tax=Staphylotrichum tortipilum TaxID=2831512 RepID=A0AAN6RTP6_9PEZI|nr:4-coumarate--CoA ligase-like 7 [Staphylotrichum longicolle]
MTISSRWEVGIPNCSLQEWIFGSVCGEVPHYHAFIDPEKPDTDYLTLWGYRSLSKRIAMGLQKAGLQIGDRVLLVSPNSLYVPPAFLGVLMAGGIVSGASPAFVTRELAYQLKDSGATFMFAAEQCLATALQAATDAGLPHDRVYVLGDADRAMTRLVLSETPAPGPGYRTPTPGNTGPRHWTELIQGTRRSSNDWCWVEPDDATRTTCCLNYSSGTTGVPKGVEISHGSYVANGVNVAHITRFRPDFEERRKLDRGLCFLPMFHAYGQTYFIANLPHLRIPVYVMGAFSLPKMLEYIERFRITTLPLVPPIVVAIAKNRNLVARHDLSSIENMGSGAAPLSREVCEEVESLFPGKDMYIRQGWGMTEVTCTAMAWDPTTTTKGSAGVGELIPNCKAKLMALDGTTEILRAGERGELWVTGPTLMRGYWRRPDATAEAIVVDADGTRWLRTGDVAFVDEYRPGGIFHVVDRVKELIKVKGNQVAPAELEGLLLESPDVADAAVVGVNGPDGGERPRAYVVKSQGSKATERDVVGWMRGKAAAYKQLTGGVVFVEAIPKNPSGKILRKQVREWVKAELPPVPSKL